MSILAFIFSISAFRVASSVFTCSYASLLTASRCNKAFWRKTRSSASGIWASNRFSWACNCRSFTLANSSPRLTELPSVKKISVIFPEVSKERFTSSSGTKRPVTNISSVSKWGVMTWAFTFSVFDLFSLGSASAAVNSSFSCGVNW